MYNISYREKDKGEKRVLCIDQGDFMAVREYEILVSKESTQRQLRLLECKSRVEDREVLFQYEIGERRTLKEHTSRIKLGKDEFLSVMSVLADALTNVISVGLEQSNIIIDADLIYIGEADVLLVCFPVEIMVDVKAEFVRLLGFLADKIDPKAKSMFLDVKNIASSDFSFAAIRDKVDFLFGNEGFGNEGIDNKITVDDHKPEEKYSKTEDAKEYTKEKDEEKASKEKDSREKASKEKVSIDRIPGGNAWVFDDYEDSKRIGVIPEGNSDEISGSGKKEKKVGFFGRIFSGEKQPKEKPLKEKPPKKKKKDSKRDNGKNLKQDTRTEIDTTTLIEEEDKYDEVTQLQEVVEVAYLVNEKMVAGVAESIKILEFPYTIGRSSATSANHLRLDIKSISAVHARLFHENEMFYIMDVGTTGEGSTGGTFINGGEKLNPMEKVRIKSGDRLSFYKTDFRFEVREEEI